MPHGACLRVRNLPLHTSTLCLIPHHLMCGVIIKPLWPFPSWSRGRGRGNLCPAAAAAAEPGQHISPPAYISCGGGAVDMRLHRRSPWATQHSPGVNLAPPGPGTRRSIPRRYPRFATVPGAGSYVVKTKFFFLFSFCLYGTYVDCTDGSELTYLLRPSRRLPIA